MYISEQAYTWIIPKMYTIVAAEQCRSRLVLTIRGTESCLFPSHATILYTLSWECHWGFLLCVPIGLCCHAVGPSVQYCWRWSAAALPGSVRNISLPDVVVIEPGVFCIQSWCFFLSWFFCFLEQALQSGSLVGDITAAQLKNRVQKVLAS